MNIYADGSGYNDGSCAICVKFEHKRKNLKKEWDYLEVFYEPIDSETLEYMALIKALELARNCDEFVYSDNLGVVDEINLLRKPKPRNERLHNKARELLKKKEKLRVLWIPRAKNLAGIYLEHRLKLLKKNNKQMFKPFKHLVNRRRVWKQKKYGKARKI